MDRRNCPGCWNVIGDRDPACRTCGLPLSAAPAGDLWLVQAEINEIDAAVRGLEARRAELDEHRTRLLMLLRAQQHAPTAPAPAEVSAPVETVAGVAAQGLPESSVGAGGGDPAVVEARGGDPAVQGPRRDLSRYAVQNLLLLLGGLMLGIAAVVFTVVSWGHLSIRAAILAIITMGTLSFPWLLVRRRLHSTAETVAYIGLVFLPLTGVAVANAIAGRSTAPDEIDLPGSDGTGFWAAAAGSALLAMLWAAYARIAPLRLPAPTALALAQVPLPLGAVALGPTPTGVALALILTAAFDLLVWTRVSGKAERAVAAGGGLLAGVTGSATALGESVQATSLDEALRVSGVLVLAAVVAAGCGWFLRDEVWRGIASGLSGVCAVASCATPAAEVLPGEWAVAAYAASACLLLAGISWAPQRLRLGAGTAGAAALALTVVGVTPEVLLTAIAPLSGNVDAATWNTEGPRAALAFGLDDMAAMGTPASPLVLVAASIVALVLSRRLPDSAADAVPRAVLRAVMRGVALVLAAAAVLVLPAATGLPYGASVAVVLALTTVLLAIACVARDVAFTSVATGLGVYAAVLASLWPLGDDSLRPVAAVVVAVAFLAFAGPARTTVAQVAMAAGTVLGGGALLITLWDTYAWPLELLPFALLGVRLVAVVVALPTGGPPRALARAVVGTRRTVRTVRTVALGAVFAVLRVVPPGAALRAHRPAQAVTLDIASAVVSLVAVGIGVAWLPTQGIGATWAGVLGLTLAVAALLGAATAWSLRRVALPAAGAIGESYVFALLAPLPLSDAFFPALFGPYGWLAKTWAGTSESARGALTPEAAWTVRPMLMPVLVLAAVAAICAAGVHRGRWAALGVAQVAVPVALAPVPLAADLPYWAALSFLVALTAGLALWAAMNRAAAGGTALWTATLAVSWSLADRTATLAVLAALALAGLVCALRGGNSPVASVASAVTTLVVGAEGAAAALAGDLPARHAAFVVLALAALAVRAGALIGDRRTRIAHALNAGAFVLWAGALGMTGGHTHQGTLVLALGGLIAVMAAARLHGQARSAVLVFAWLISGLALLLHLPRLFWALFAPYEWTGRAWSEDIRSFQESPLLNDTGVSVPTAAAVAAGLAAVTAIASARLLDGARGAYRAAVLAVPPAMLVLPWTADLPHGAGLALVCALVTALAVRTALSRTMDWFAGAMALWLTTLAVAWSLPMTATTLAVAAGIAVLATGCALTARNGAMRCASSATAVLASAGLVAAAVLAGGFGVELAGLAVLAAVAAPSALGAWEIGHRYHMPGLAVEFAGHAVAAVGVALACVAGVPYACLSLTGAGALALAVAIRTDRRLPGLGAGAVLLHLALWLLLGDAEVAAPEAYTASVSALLLFGGWWLRRRDDTLSSWAAYGPALALTLLPSLVMAWNDDGLIRPLLLGLVAFAVTLAGAWARLQALLLLGGTILVVNAAHELSPALADLVGNGPRWLPIALTGAALLFTGATYEHRLRDIRRVRRSIAGMR
ncbi:SCO7613 C-terminal domain-containing membrane protein [Spirillospora sp. CA-255316]